MLQYEACYTCNKPVNMGLTSFFIFAECEECEELNGVFVFCSEECREKFVPPTDDEMHEMIDDEEDDDYTIFNHEN